MSNKTKEGYITYDPDKYMAKLEKQYKIMLRQTQFIIAHFEHWSREAFLSNMELHGFTYKTLFSKESLVQSRYPIVVEIDEKKLWGITSSAIVGASVSKHISESIFFDYYMSFYYDPIEFSFESDGSDIATYCKKIVDDVYEGLSDADKDTLYNHPEPSRYHFTLGMTIRNKYFYSISDDINSELIEPDDLSSWIIGQVIRRVYESSGSLSKGLIYLADQEEQ